MTTKDIYLQEHHVLIKDQEVHGEGIVTVSGRDKPGSLKWNKLKSTKDKVWSPN